MTEFGAVLGMTTTAAKRMIGHAQELRYRLPRAWKRVQSGTVAPWKATRLADKTIHATPALSDETHHVDFHEEIVNFDGTMILEAHLDLADALDLKLAVEQVAAALAAEGCAESEGPCAGDHRPRRPRPG